MRHPAISQEEIGKHSRSKRSVHIAARTKAAHNKTVAEALELQIESREGNKRKYALAGIKADIANKRLFGLFVRMGLPPMGGGTSTTGGNHTPHPSPKSKSNGKHNMANRTTKTNNTTTAPPTPTTYTTTALLGM
jgi:hypothetical protein